MTLRTLIAASFLATALGGAAQAATVCGGAPPEGVAEIRGPVLEVLDGERICVALGADPSLWAPVRLADGPMKVSDSPPPTRGALMAASFGQDVACRIVGRDAEGLIAECLTQQGSVGQLAQQPWIIKAGQVWR